jgi:hypothetical protein
MSDPEPTTEPVKLPGPNIWMVTVLAALAVVLALVGIDIALVNGSTAQAKPVSQVVHVSGAPAVQRQLYLTVSPGLKPGPDGKLHDAYSQTTFYVHVGQPVKLVINNTDSAPHSITSAAADVNILVKPGTHTYTLLVKKAGKFMWMCNMPCDPFSMSHMGYMMGDIVAS